MSPPAPPGGRSEEHTSELQSPPTRRSSDLAGPRLLEQAGDFPGRAAQAVLRDHEVHPGRRQADHQADDHHHDHQLDQREPPASNRDRNTNRGCPPLPPRGGDRKSTRLNSSHPLHDALPISRDRACLNRPATSRAAPRRRYFGTMKSIRVAARPTIRPTITTTTISSTSVNPPRATGTGTRTGDVPPCPPGGEIGRAHV